MARPKPRHEHLHTLGSLKSIAVCWKIPYRYLSRLSKLPGFPQAYKMAWQMNDNITTADYLYSREAVIEFLREHVNELPQDDALGFRYTKEHIDGKRKTKGR